MIRILITLLFLSNLLFSQRISSIDVEGISRLKTDDIYRICGLYPTMMFDSDSDYNEKINQAIKKLWEINRFSDIVSLCKEEYCVSQIVIGDGTNCKYIEY